MLGQGLQQLARVYHHNQETSQSAFLLNYSLFAQTCLKPKDDWAGPIFNKIHKKTWKIYQCC